jgi:hypothetical protein
LELALEKSYELRECRYAVAEHHFLKTMRKSFLQVADLQLGTYKKVRMPIRAD